jgi:hypothetical protein
VLADPYVGGLAEPPEGGAHMGPLFAASIKEQFGRLRDADWWYYENGANNKLYNASEIEEIRSTSETHAVFFCVSFVCVCDGGWGWLAPSKAVIAKSCHTIWRWAYAAL